MLKTVSSAGGGGGATPPGGSTTQIQYNNAGAFAGTSRLTFDGTTLAVSNPTVTNYIETLYAPAAGSAFTVDLTNGTVQKFSLNANGTITLPASAAGKSFVIMLAQDGTGSRTVTWSGVTWPGGTAPTVTSTASKMDIYSFFSDGTNTYGVTVGQNY